ncbi:MAG: hypothetical protein NTW03_14640 [Verrucomicrobia bacterium]|nr:hypothetical protein [Verrucomicrobiota bacterium]
MNPGDLPGEMSEKSPSPIGWERAGVRVHGSALTFVVLVPTELATQDG